VGIAGAKPKPWALKVLEGGRAAERIKRQGPPVKPPARCGRPRSNGTPCQLKAGWGTENDIGPCKWHEGQEPIDFGEPPDFVLAHLPKKAQEFWRMMAPDLVATDRLRTEDLPAFVQLCLAYHFTLDAGDEMVAEGLVIKGRETRNVRRPHPATQTWKDGLKLFKALACEFGMTPSSRARLQLPAGPDPENPWGKY